MPCGKALGFGFSNKEDKNFGGIFQGASLSFFHFPWSLS
jgi:hypothetical protein